MVLDRLIISEKNKHDLYKFLVEIDGDFNPSLSDKVCFNDFINKVFDKGYVYAFIEKQVLAGIICFYANNNLNKTSYCSLLCVKEGYRGKGISKVLVNLFCEVSLKNKMKFATIHTNNPIALNLYLKQKFVIDEIITIGETKRYYLKKKLI